MLLALTFATGVSGSALLHLLHVHGDCTKPKLAALLSVLSAPAQDNVPKLSMYRWACLGATSSLMSSACNPAWLAR